eukprot:11211147-Alexandrium_andersonii.AAC.1
MPSLLGTGTSHSNLLVAVQHVILSCSFAFVFCHLGLASLHVTGRAIHIQSCVQLLPLALALV